MSGPEGHCPIPDSFASFFMSGRERADSCVDNRSLVAVVKGFDWQLGGGLIDKDYPLLFL